MATYARLGLAVTGAIVGSYFGQPGLGFALGSLAGSMLFPGEGMTSEGPRLSDLAVTGSGFGGMIPIPFGTMRMSGNIVWATPIQEERNKQKMGGKGGGPQSTSVTYAYYGNFAVVFGEGVAVDVLRIWADGKLIYDQKSGSSGARLEDLNFRFYPGDEEQLPDPLIESYVGVGNTPAHRGLAYIVFERMPLAPYGNRIPNITAEINFEDASDTSVTVTTGPDIGEGHDMDDLLIDWTRRRAYAIQTDRTTINAFDLNSLSKVATLYTQVGPHNSFVTALCERDGNFMYHKGPTDNTDYVVDPYTGVVLRSNGSGTRVHNTQAVVTTLYLPMTSYSIIETLVSRSGSVLRVHDWEFLEHRYDFSLAGYVTSTLVGSQVGVTWAAWFKSTGIVPVSLTNKMETTEVGALRAGAAYLEHTEITPADLGGSAFTIPGSGDLHLEYDPTTNSILFGVGVTGRGPVVVRWSPEVGVVWATDVPFVPGDFGLITSSRGPSGHLRGGTWAYLETPTSGPDQNHKIVRVSIASGSLGSGYDGTVTYNSLGQGVMAYDDDTNTLYGLEAFESGDHFKKVQLGGRDAVSASLADIVRALGERVGFDPAADFDVSDLEDLYVPGFAVTRQISVKELIAPLALTYFFDVVESDYKLVFRLRGDAVEATVTQAEMVVDGDSEPYSERRVQEVELPRRYALSFWNSDADYLPDTQQGQRIRAPYAFTRSDDVTTVAVAVAQAAEFMKRAAEKILYTMWRERSITSARLPWTYLYLDPTDPVQLSLDDGRSFRARLTQHNVGVDFTVEATAVNEAPAQYASTVGADGASPPPQTIPALGASELFLLDSTLLRDVDAAPATQSRAYYLGSNFGSGAWPGADFQRSLDGAYTWETVDRILSAAPWGTLRAALPAPDSFWLWDEENVVDVQMVVGSTSLESATELEVLNGANALAVVNADGTLEVLLYRDVEDLGNGRLRLSGLIRGTRGTDTMAEATHAAGSRVIALTVDTTEAFVQLQTRLGVEQHFRAITVGAIPDNTAAVPFTYTGRDLMPYAPVHVEAVDNAGDIDFTWVRRTRLGGDEWTDGDATVPLSEATEEYELDVLDAPGGTVLRTLTTSTPDVTYNAADVTSDFGGVPAEIDVVVYQISADVGRGFGRAVTIPVT